MNRKGMWAVVTGASSGIGESAAKLLALEGVNLILVARRKDRLETLGQDLKTKYGIEFQVISADLSKSEDVKRVYEEATQNGRAVQLLVNNAGIGYYGPFLDHEVSKQINTIQLNVTALVELTYYFVGHMKKHGKQSFIGNVGSIASFISVPNFAVYCGSKSFVKEFSHTLNHELRGSNISVTLISPGGTYTEFMDHAGQVLKKSGHATMMTSEEVARVGIKGTFARRRDVVPGLPNWLMTFLPRIMPTDLLLTISNFAMKSSVAMKSH